MRMQEMKAELRRCIEHNLPVCIVSSPGCGKSDACDQVVSELPDTDFMVMHPAISEPSTFEGMPALIDSSHAEFIPFGQLRQLMEAKRRLVVLIDDIGQATAATQAALMQLLLLREINGKRISDHVVFIGATNRRSDKAGVTGMITPLRDRFCTFINLEPDSDAWVEWAIASNLPMEVIGFIRFRPELLSKFEATSDFVKSPTARAWAFVGALTKAGCTSTEMFCGTVGDGAGSEYVGFLRVFKELPTLDSIYAAPDQATVPSSPAALYAICAALSGKIDKKNCDASIRYASRLPAEFSVLMVRDGLRKCKDIAETKAFITWATKHKDVLI